VTMAEGGATGTILMDILKKRTEEEELIATGRKLLSQAEYTGTVKLSSEDLSLAVSRDGNENFIFMSAHVDGLLCGTAYRFFLTCRNSIGDSPSSQMSYTISTTAGRPHQPDPPVLVEADLLSIVVKWTAPYDGGTSLLGYRCRWI
jgi:hypothetical protein